MAEQPTTPEAPPVLSPAHTESAQPPEQQLHKGEIPEAEKGRDSDSPEEGDQDSGDDYKQKDDSSSSASADSRDASPRRHRRPPQKPKRQLRGRKGLAARTLPEKRYFAPWETVGMPSQEFSEV